MINLDEILKAQKFSDLFPEGTKKELRTLRKATHPDLHPADTAKAEKAFIHVNLIWGLKNAPASATAATANAKPPVPDNTIITKKHDYKIIKTARTKNSTITYNATYDVDKEVTLTIATHPKVGAELLNGTKNLKQIRTTIPDQFMEFFPETLDAFNIQQDKTKLFGIAQQGSQGWYTLAEVKERYPNGIDGQDIAWMYRRMLVSIGNTHDAGYAHGAPTGDAFLIEPETHKFLLVNWQFSQELGKDMNMLTPDIKKYYETEKSTSIKKDLQILSETARDLLEDKAPKRMKAFLFGMKRFPTETAREALIEFDQLLEDLYGQRSFHRFTM
jgi:hypothetical protein